MAPSSTLMRRNFALPTLFSSSAGGRLQERNAMAKTAADVLVETLLDWGVDTVFGLPGDGINGIMEALRTRQDKIRFIQVRHEESAAFMACGYAKYSGRLGVCLATSGPGGIHLLNGLYDAKLDRAAAILNEGRQVCILAGRGALRARDELSAIAEKLAAPVAKALLGKGALEDRHPHCTGGVGLLGTAPSQDALAGCDTLLIVGSSLPYLEVYPNPGDARAVQIDNDGMRIGLRYPVECGLVGDAAATLRALAARVKPKADRK